MSTANRPSTRLRAATSTDLPRILALLAASELPTQGVAKALDDFVVFENEGEIIAVGGFERYGSSALLRSLAVSPAHRGAGLADALCDRLEADAARFGLETVFLLTETADGFFARRGYARLGREVAPPEIAASEEFASICPDSAVFMGRTTSAGGLG